LQSARLPGRNQRCGAREADAVVATGGRDAKSSDGEAIANRDGSELQLIGDARVVREASATDAAIEFRGEFLHCFQNTERVRSHLPVVVTQGNTEIRGDAMAYDNLARVLDLKGHLRAVFTPPPPRKK